MNVDADTIKNLEWIVKEWSRTQDLKGKAKLYDYCKKDKDLSQALDDGKNCWNIDNPLGEGASDWFYETRNILRMIKNGEINYKETA